MCMGSDPGNTGGYDNVIDVSTPEARRRDNLVRQGQTYDTATSFLPRLFGESRTDQAIAKDKAGVARPEQGGQAAGIGFGPLAAIATAATALTGIGLPISMGISTMAGAADKNMGNPDIIRGDIRGRVTSPMAQRLKQTRLEREQGAVEGSTLGGGRIGYGLGR